jgi:hypothetical protein
MADIGSAAVDAARLEEVSAALGRQRLHELILVLAGRVQTLAEGAELFPESAEEFLAGLHQSRGSAASLGFLAVAEGFSRVEVLGRQALRLAEAGEHDLAAAWEAVRQAGRVLPGLWEDAERAREELQF